jgi:hypothetical protein
VIDLDLDKIRVGSSDITKSNRKKLKRCDREGQFIKGPLPKGWLKVAASLGGKSLHVGLALWFAYGFEREERFRFTPKWYRWLGISRPTLARSLKRLKEAGLIRLEYRPGCSPIVTILNAPESQEVTNL